MDASESPPASAFVARLQLRLRLRPPLSTYLQDLVLQTPFPLLAVAWLAIYALVGFLFFAIYVTDLNALSRGGAPVDALDALSFSFVTQATIGYGDVVPTGWWRLFANLQAIFGTGLNGAAIGLLTFRMLRRAPPIRMPRRIVFHAVNTNRHVFWLRYLSVDTRPLVDTSVNVFFLADGSRTNATYDSLAGQVGAMQMETVPPFLTMALFIDASLEPVLIHTPGHLAMLNDAKIPLHPSMFVRDGAIDPSARLLVRIRGHHSATGELLAAAQEYYARDIVCGSFDSINNNLVNSLSPRLRRRYATPRFDKVLPTTGKRCSACAVLPLCPFMITSDTTGS